MKKSAMLVGINDYGDYARTLKGCVNDAKRMAKLLHRHGDEKGDLNFETQLLADDYYHFPALDREFLLEKLDMLFHANTDLALFYFAGHGAQDENGGYIVPAGAKSKHDHIPFTTLVDMANQSSIDEIIIILDCCHAGHISNEFNANELAKDIARIREGVIIIAGSDEDEFAAERERKGLFTKLIADGLQGEAANLKGEVTLASLYSYADQLLNTFSQRPLFKAHIERRIIIRKVEPRIPFNTIRMLTTFFPKLDAKFDLNPSFEKTHETAKPENVEKFELLQELRSVYLVEPIDEKHMYYAAIRNKACRMTTLGKFYWRMVDKNLI